MTPTPRGHVPLKYFSEIFHLESGPATLMSSIIFPRKVGPALRQTTQTSTQIKADHVMSLLTQTLSTGFSSASGMWACLSRALTLGLSHSWAHPTLLSSAVSAPPTPGLQGLMFFSSELLYACPWSSLELYPWGCCSNGLSLSPDKFLYLRWYAQDLPRMRPLSKLSGDGKYHTLPTTGCIVDP